MSIIRATSDDIPRILPCARRFCEILKWKLDEPGFVKHIQDLIDAGTGAVFLIESGNTIVGGLGGSLQREPIGGQSIAVEMFWFVNSEHRGSIDSVRLLALFERWAKESGAARVCMIAMQDSDPEAMDRLYNRLGYRKLETTYVK